MKRDNSLAVFYRENNGKSLFYKSNEDFFFLSVESISDKEKEKNRKTGGMQLVTVKYFQQVPQIPKQSMNA